MTEPRESAGIPADVATYAAAHPVGHMRGPVTQVTVYRFGPGVEPASAMLRLTVQCSVCHRRFDRAVAASRDMVERYLCTLCASPEQQRRKPERYV